MTTIYRGVKVSPSQKNTTSAQSGFYRGFRWTSDNLDSNPQLTSGTYRGVKWVA